MMSAWLGNLRFAVRTSLRTPGFTAVVVATLALGIGANAAVFSVVDAVLLRELPYGEPDRLVTLHTEAADGDPRRSGVDFALARDLAAEPALFESVAVWRAWEPTLAGAEAPEVVAAADVGREMFSGVLRVRPELGRDFLPADEVPGAPGVVLLSHGAWEARFGADPDIVGRSLSLSGMPYVVVGVLPAGFHPPFAPEAELWRALGPSPALSCVRGCRELGAQGRLSRGVTLPRARAQGDALTARLVESYPETAGHRLVIESLRDELTRPRAQALWSLFGAVGFALLIACANVGGLLLARGATRDAELAVRIALGAGRATLMMEMLLESLVLAGLGGLGGLAVASWGTDLLLALAPPGTLVPGAEPGVDTRVLVFTAALALGTALLFGLLPAWRAGRRGVNAGLRTRVGSGGGGGAGGGLAAAQLALALVLCVGAGLLVRSFQRLSALDLGFEPRGVLTLDLTLPAERYTGRTGQRAFYPAVLERLRALPGVRAAGLGSPRPLARGDTAVAMRIEGPSADPGALFPVRLRRASEGYLEALGVEVLAGRPFAADDDPGNERVVVVNQTLARRYFPEGDAVGRRVGFGPAEHPEWRRIVGVVHDLRREGVRSPVQPALYVPLAQEPAAVVSVVLLTEGDGAVAGAARAAIAELDPAMAPARVTWLEEEVQASLEPDRFAGELVGAFGLAALLLSALGVYAVVSQRVVRRTRELGIHLALGADEARVRTLVLRGALGLAGTGVVLGLALTAVLGRLAQGLLFEVSPYDPIVLGSAVVVLGAVATLAGWLPARRAARTDARGVLGRD